MMMFGYDYMKFQVLRRF